MNPGRMLEQISVNGEIVAAVFEDQEEDRYVVALGDGKTSSHRHFDDAVRSLERFTGPTEETLGEPEASFVAEGVAA